MNYNPYDLVALLVNGKPIQGRPFAFDSDVVNQKKMTNAFGSPVKPIRVMTMCPDCCQGLELDVKLGDPPFEPFVASCPSCRPGPVALVDPFVNPVLTGRVTPQDLDPTLHDPVKPLAASEGSVAQRFAMPSPAPGEAQKVPAPATAPRTAKKPKKAKKKPGEAAPLVQQVLPVSPGDFVLTTQGGRATDLPVAEGVGQEQDFDDSDMVEGDE